MKKGEDYIGITVSFFCHDGQGNFVMNKRSANCRDEHGRWDIGGGGVEFGEDIEARLRMEIREEYCTDVLSYEFLGYRNVLRENSGRPTHWLSLDFKVLVDRASVAIGEPHKFDDLQWYRLERLPAPVHSQFPTFLEKYSAQLV